ncbi:hypothetical protein QTP88_014134 [Uroleucon formosanum]
MYINALNILGSTEMFIYCPNNACMAENIIIICGLQGDYFSTPPLIHQTYLMISKLHTRIVVVSVLHTLAFSIFTVSVSDKVLLLSCDLLLFNIHSPKARLFPKRFERRVRSQFVSRPVSKGSIR